jgi:UDPglucose--hexose-1-phosphate uridylyltransferase
MIGGAVVLPELRKDPIVGRWVIIATERARRPSDFVRVSATTNGVRFCPFCPGSEHKTPPELLAYRNGNGWTLRVVPNKFPALRVEGELDRKGEGLYDKTNGVGAHEVIIETPHHQLTFADLEEKRIEDVFWAFRERLVDLKKDRRLRYILIFKNHGEAAGATLEHTHWQLIALPIVPKEAQEEIQGAKRYYKYKERCIYCDISRQELESGDRVIMETDHFVVIAPYAARFPFETWVIPRKHASHFEASDGAVLPDLAHVMKTTMRKLDRVLEIPPYNCVLHTSPLQEGATDHYHWHLEIIPKLTRVAGFEVGSGFYINPTPPEEAAKFLREAPAS